MTTSSATSADEGEQGKKARSKTRGVVSIAPERCKGCGYCIEFCPMNVLAMSTKFNTKGYHYPEVVLLDKCTGCDLCGMYCPDFAIHGERIPPAGSKKE